MITCGHVAHIKLGQECLELGNTDAKRDFTDVRDVVRAYTLSSTANPERYIM